VFTLVRRFIKTGFGFLLLGLAIGLWMQVQRELMGIWPHPYLRSAHAHAVGSGFVLYLIFGVALWLFPRAAKDDTRYRPARIEAAYWILTVATLARILGEVARGTVEAPWLAAVILAGGAGQVTGIVLYLHAMWGRIRAVGSHLREAKGERF
jgi:heme/copper-type cytochrome/quinol oxidase subunit 1